MVQPKSWHMRGRHVERTRAFRAAQYAAPCLSVTNTSGCPTAGGSPLTFDRRAKTWVGVGRSAIDHALGAQGWKIVGLLRLSPVMPLGLSTYLFGVTSIDFVPYALASAFGVIPGTLMYVYFGSVARDLADKPATPPWIKWTIGALTVIVIIYVTRFAKRALSQKIS